MTIDLDRHLAPIEPAEDAARCGAEDHPLGVIGADVDGNDDRLITVHERQTSEPGPGQTEPDQRLVQVLHSIVGRDASTRSCETTTSRTRRPGQPPHDGARPGCHASTRETTSSWSRLHVHRRTSFFLTPPSSASRRPGPKVTPPQNVAHDPLQPPPPLSSFCPIGPRRRDRPTLTSWTDPRTSSSVSTVQLTQPPRCVGPTRTVGATTSRSPRSHRSASATTRIRATDATPAFDLAASVTAALGANHEVRSTSTTARAVDVLEQASRTAELLVVGARHLDRDGHHLLRQSVARDLAHHTTCPVAIGATTQSSPTIRSSSSSSAPPQR